MCVWEREPETERERTLCCGWTQKPDARVNPSLLSVCLREQRMGSSFCLSLWTCFNSDEWWLPCTIPAVHLQKHTQNTNTPRAEHTSHRFTWPCLWFISEHLLRRHIQKCKDADVMLRKRWITLCVKQSLVPWTITRLSHWNHGIQMHRLRTDYFDTGCSVYR